MLERRSLDFKSALGYSRILDSERERYAGRNQLKWVELKFQFLSLRVIRGLSVRFFKRD